MSAAPSRTTFLLSVLLLLLVVIVLPAAAGQAQQECSIDNAASFVAQQAAQICGDVEIEQALKTVRVDAEEQAGRALAKLRFRSALDLQVLATGEREADELMRELSTLGLSISDRAKIRLLVGERSGRMIEVFAPKQHSDAGPSRRVRLQEQSSSGGMSMDTLAIVVSVLVGAAGYLVQAYSARKVQEEMANRAREAHFAEQRREREHEQMQAQIARTSRWLDGCCVPLFDGLYHVIGNRMSIVGTLVHELETRDPSAVNEMLSKSERIQKIDEDGRIRSTQTGGVMWEPRSSDVLTDTFAHHGLASTSAAVWSIVAADFYFTLSQPFCHELPRVLMKMIAADPSDQSASWYRSYVKTMLLPVCLQLADVLKIHSAVIEWPSKEWLASKFPDVPWKVNASALFSHQWATYCTTFQWIADQWAGGDYSLIRPSGISQPLGGLLPTISWSRQQGEAKQSELIGMTTMDEVNLDALITQSRVYVEHK